MVPLDRYSTVNAAPGINYQEADPLYLTGFLVQLCDNTDLHFLYLEFQLLHCKILPEKTSVTE